MSKGRNLFGRIEVLVLLAVVFLAASTLALVAAAHGIPRLLPTVEGGIIPAAARILQRNGAVFSILRHDVQNVKAQLLGRAAGVFAPSPPFVVRVSEPVGQLLLRPDVDGNTGSSRLHSNEDNSVSSADDSIVPAIDSANPTAILPPTEPTDNDDDSAPKSIADLPQGVRQLPSRSLPSPLPRFAWTDDDDIDAVYTYVNGSDPVWRAAATSIAASAGMHLRENKFRDWNELLFSMRSIYSYAPWVRKIFIVVAGPSQVPAWLNVTDERVRIVYHREIFDNPDIQLPTLNSFAIESVLHHIPGLSNHFLYFNNDFLLGRALSRSAFMAEGGRTYVQYVDWALDYSNTGTTCNEELELAVAASRAGQHMPYNRGPIVSCAGQVLAHDSTVAAHFLGERVTNWFPHLPHLWERRVMYAVERELMTPLTVLRSSRMRNADADVNVHIQYEMWRRRAARRRVDGEPRVNTSRISDVRFMYHFAIIDETCNADFYTKLNFVMLNGPPLFVSVDDGMGETTAATLAYEYERLTAWFQRNWPRPGPWELADSVPKLIDVENFRETPPPPQRHGPEPSAPPLGLLAGMVKPPTMLSDDAM